MALLEKSEKDDYYRNDSLDAGRMHVVAPAVLKDVADAVRGRERCGGGGEVRGCGFVAFFDEGVGVGVVVIGEEEEGVVVVVVVEGNRGGDGGGGGGLGDDDDGRR
jgi:hypothetical protein